MDTTAETPVVEQAPEAATEATDETTEPQEDTAEIKVLVEFTLTAADTGCTAPRERIEAALKDQIETYLGDFEVDPDPDDETAPLVGYAVTDAKISETDLDA